MKSSDEMINSLYERRDNYISERKARNKTIVKTVSAVFSVCLVALIGVGVFTLGWFKANDKPASPSDSTSIIENTEESDTADILIYAPNHDENDASGGIYQGGTADSLGRLSISGANYIQIGTANEAVGYTKKEYLGKASEFSDLYRKFADEDGIDGDVYSVNESPDILLIYLSNEGVVVLSSETNGDPANVLENDNQNGGENIGGINIPTLPATNEIDLVGDKITEEEAKQYFEETSASIISSLSASGVEADNIRISDTGYCHINYDGTAGKNLEIRQNFRDYLVYNGDRLVAIVTLTKDNGLLSSTPAFGGEWFDDYNEFLKQHEGQKLVYLYAGWMEIIIAPDNTCTNPMGLDVSEYLKGIEDPYKWFYNKAAVYTP